jgi:hypothetical protein
MTQSGDICQGWEDHHKQQGGYQWELQVAGEERLGNGNSRAIPKGNAVDQRRETGHHLVDEELATLGEDKWGEGEIGQTMVLGDAVMNASRSEHLSIVT